MELSEAIVKRIKKLMKIKNVKSNYELGTLSRH